MSSYSHYMHIINGIVSYKIMYVHGWYEVFVTWKLGVYLFHHLYTLWVPQH